MASWSAGDSYLWKGRTGVLSMFHGYDARGYDDKYTLRYSDGTTEEVDRYSLNDHNKVYASGVYRLGDIVEIKSDDPLVDELIRGKLVEITGADDDRPYVVKSLYGEETTKFAAYEMNKVMTALSWEKRRESTQAIRDRLKIAEAEVFALRTALEVLEYGAGGH